MHSIKVVSYNICHAQGMDGKVDLDRVGQLLKQTGAYIMGLQEVDKHHPRSRFTHQARTLGQMLHRAWVFGANLDWGVSQYGNAILSRGPILQHRQHLLPSKSEQRGLLEAELQYYHHKIRFFCTHLGLNKEERQEQVQEILRIIGHSQEPAILVGDFNDDRNSKEYCELTRIFKDATAVSRHIKSYPANCPQEQIDFIFVTQEWQVVSAVALHSDASDHLPLLVELRLTGIDLESNNPVKLLSDQSN